MKGVLIKMFNSVAITKNGTCFIISRAEKLETLQKVDLPYIKHLIEDRDVIRGEFGVVHSDNIDCVIIREE